MLITRLTSPSNTIIRTNWLHATNGWWYETQWFADGTKCETTWEQREDGRLIPISLGPRVAGTASTSGLPG